MSEFIHEYKVNYAKFHHTFDFLFHLCLQEWGGNDACLKLPWNIFLAGVTDGEGRLTECRTGRVISLEKDHYCLIPKNCEIRYDLRVEQKILNIQFSLESYPRVDLFEHSDSVFTGYDPDLVAKLSQEIQHDETPFSMLWIRSRLTLLAVELKPMQLEDSLLHDDFVQKLQALLNNPVAYRSVKTIAYAMQMRPESFSRKFHRTFGTVPKIYFDQLLLSRAFHLLRSGRNSNVVARELHFCSEYHFSRFIRRMTGKSIRSMKGRI